MRPSNPLGLFGMLAGEWGKTSQPLQERASILPLGQYEDGSVGMAWPGLLAAPVEGVANFGKYGYGEEAVPYNAGMAFDAAGGAMTGGLGVGLAGGLADNAVGSAGGNLAKGAADLPMDLASRMARAKEMGFNRRLYRGDDNMDSIEAFDLNKSGSNLPAFYADGIHFSELPDDAASYGKLGEYLTRSNKTFTFDDADPDMMSKIQTIYPGADLSLSAGDGLPMRQTKDWTQALMDAGYDSVAVKNRRGQDEEFVVLDPRNIRSVNAAFDPAMRDSANLLAANAKTGAAIPAGMEASQDQDTDPAILEYLRLMSARQ